MEMLARLEVAEAESRIMAKIAKGIYRQLVREHKLVQRAIKRYKAGLLVCALLLIFVGGCQALKGGLNDISWSSKTLADNITSTEEQE